MPLQFQNVSVTLGALDQKKARQVRGEGSLDSAINVEFQKDGRLNKRRGYARISVANIVGTATADVVMTHLATLRDELVVFSYDYVFGLGDRESALRGEDALVYRGPANRGACRMTFVSQSRISADYAEATP